MNPSEPATLHAPIVPLLMEGAQEVLGPEALQQVLSGMQSGDPQADGDGAREYAMLTGALEQQFGTAGGRGLALRIGRSALKYLVQRHGAALGLTTAAFRLQRAPQRLHAGLRLLAQQVAADSGDVVVIEESETHWIWRAERCAVCAGRQADSPGCYLTVGLIQAFFTWAGGGRYYRVTETECRAAGDPACVFWIEKKPLD